MTQIRIIVTALKGQAERTVKRLALNATALLIKDTPVDTGWAQGNWIPSVGTPRVSTAGSRAAAEDGKIDRGPQNAGFAAIANYKLGPAIFISNNVPYIKRLNAGTSKKAPAAFVQAAVLRAVRNTTRRA